MKAPELLSELRYIAESPPRNFGGFHPRAVAVAKAAIAELSEGMSEKAIIAAVHRVLIRRAAKRSQSSKPSGDRIVSPPSPVLSPKPCLRLRLRKAIR